MTSSEIRLRAADPAQRADLLDELGESRHPEALSLATRFARDADSKTRSAALRCIAAVGMKEGEVVVRAALADVESLVRIEAVEALVALCSVDEESLVELRRRLSDEDEGVRAYVGWAFGRLGGANDVGPLLDRLRDEESAVVEAGLLEGLYRLTQEEAYLRGLMEKLSDPDGEARAFTSSSLVGIASRENVCALIARLEGAVFVEPFPAVRTVLERNLRELANMDADDDFELR